MNRFRAIGGGLLLAIMIAGCSSGSTPSGAEATATPVPTPTPDRTLPSEGAGVSFVPGAGELESIVPSQVGGLTLEYQYATGSGINASTGATPEILEFLDRVGGNIQDIQIAVGFGYSAETGAGVSIFAIRVGGADEGMLRDEFVTVMQAETPGTTAAPANIGGKDVIALTEEDATDPSSYLYANGDIVFLAGGSPMALVEDLFQQLP